MIERLNDDNDDDEIEKKKKKKLKYLLNIHFLNTFFSNPIYVDN